MRILVHEHLTGGGMIDEPQLAALAPEGEAMVRALVNDLTALPGVEISVTRDYRLDANLPAQVHVVRPGEFESVLDHAIDVSDAVWPIAPETNEILLRLTRRIRSRNRRCLGCHPEAISIASSKIATAALLARAGVPVIPAYRKLADMPEETAPVVAKPDDGAGCQDTRLFSDRSALEGWVRGRNAHGLIFQPYVAGEPRSLSALFHAGRARLLACNRQRVMCADGVFRFDGVVVNAVKDRDGRYARLANEVARAIPGLHGYAGIDFIEADTGAVILEINPRLTTSYDGLGASIGCNVAGLVLDLPASLDAGVEIRHG